MKMMRILIFSTLAFLLVVGANARERLDETRTATAEFDVTASTEISVSGKNVALKVESWDQNKVQVTAVIIFKGKETDKIMEFLDSWEEYVKDNITQTSMELAIDMNPDQPNRIQIGSGGMGIIFGYDKDDLTVTYELKVPAKNELTVKNAYEDVILVGGFSDVNLEHYSGTLQGEFIDNLDLDLKYGKAKFHTIKNANMNLYEQEMEVRILQESKIETKYSKLSFGETENIELDSYESKIELGTVKRINGELKYGRLTVENEFDEIVLTTYELDMVLGVGKVLRLNDSKYNEIEARNIDEVIFKESYEDNLEVGSIESLTMNGKYGEIEIGMLKRSIKVDGYETDVEISDIHDEVESIEFDGKYNSLVLSTSSVPFKVTADMTYGNVDYPESKLERRIYIKENSKLKMELNPKSGEEPKLIVDLKGYEMKAEIR